jgi:phosphoglycerate dehydrogenase-like enzyme
MSAGSTKMRPPQIVVANGTCLDIFNDNLDWIRSLNAEIVADESFRNVDATQIGGLLSNAHGLIGPVPFQLSHAHLQMAPRLRVISLASSGHDSIDLEVASRCGIVVTNAPAPELAEVVADHCWGLLIAIGRQIVQHDRRIRAADMYRGIGVSPWRKTLGIVGLGMIGQAVARRAAGFEMHVLATEPNPDDQFVRKHNIELVELDDLLARADFVTLHVRLTDETRCLISHSELARMKPTSFLINTARRAVVDEGALAHALSTGQLAGAALDDPPSTQQSPLLNLPNVLFTTHIGNRATTGVNAVFRLAVQNAIDVLAGRRPPHVLNPETFEAINNRSPTRVGPSDSL